MAQSKTNSTYLFPGKDGMCARVSLKRAWIQVCRRAGLAREYHVIGKRGKLLSRWRPIFRIHDLRHSFASLLVSLGVPIYSVSKLLCHRNLPTTERYAHVANQPLRAATNSFPKVLELNA
jgi:site-specific recombinase XerD